MKAVEQGDNQVTFKGRLAGIMQEVDWRWNRLGEREEIIAFV